MKKKTVALLLALTLVLGCAMGGTLAWLTSQSGTVTNTFVSGNIGDLELTETGDDGDANNNYLFTPGVGIKKNPIVTYSPVAEDGTVQNVDAYVFVKVAFDNGEWVYDSTDKEYTSENGFLSWMVDSAWTPVGGVANVFYVTVTNNATAQDAEQKWEIMESNTDTMDGVTITVSENLKKSDIESQGFGVGSLTFSAYAIQKDAMEGKTMAEIWTMASTATP